VQIRLHDIHGQKLRVGIRQGNKTRPPLLLFNGIGANIELIERTCSMRWDTARSMCWAFHGAGRSRSNSRFR
jgi:hypothetical protein